MLLAELEVEVAEEPVGRATVDEWVTKANAEGYRVILVAEIEVRPAIALVQIDGELSTLVVVGTLAGTVVRLARAAELNDLAERRLATSPRRIRS